MKLTVKQLKNIIREVVEETRSTFDESDDRVRAFYPGKSDDEIRRILISIYSDTYKDAHGVRPGRYINDADPKTMSLSDIDAATDDVHAQIDWEEDSEPSWLDEADENEDDEEILNDSLKENSERQRKDLYREFCDLYYEVNGVKQTDYKIDELSIAELHDRIERLRGEAEERMLDDDNPYLDESELQRITDP